jgi:hypothetical protein
LSAGPDGGGATNGADPGTTGMVTGPGVVCGMRLGKNVSMTSATGDVLHPVAATTTKASQSLIARSSTYPGVHSCTGRTREGRFSERKLRVDRHRPFDFRPR